MGESDVLQFISDRTLGDGLRLRVALAYLIRYGTGEPGSWIDFRTIDRIMDRLFDVDDVGVVLWLGLAYRLIEPWMVSPQSLDATIDHYLTHHAADMDTFLREVTA